MIEAKITDMTADGRGIGRADGMALFVDGALPGDVVRARVTETKKNYCFAVAVEIRERSPDRRDPFCTYIDECGGCPWGRMSVEAQDRLKEGQVREKLKRIAGIGDPVVRPIIPASAAFRYRNKAVMRVEGARVGFTVRMSHRVIDCKTCALQAEPAMACADALRSFISGDNVEHIRRMTVKTAFATGEVMVVLEMDRRSAAGTDKLVMMLDEAVTGAYSLESVALTDGKGKCTILAGKGTITDELCGLRFEISPLSFYQVNRDMAERLYDTALKYADLRGGETVFDLYCGIGTIGLAAAKSGAGKVVGVESVKEAVLAANRNAVINGIVDAVYKYGKAEEIVPQLIAQGIRPDVVILDPPRKGCEGSLIGAVADAHPERIVYVSCNPATLARDVKIFIDNEYKFIEATPVQMFLHSGHAETVALLCRKDIDSHIEVYS